MTSTGQTVDASITAFDTIGPAPLMPVLAGDAVHLPDGGAASRSTPEIRRIAVVCLVCHDDLRRADSRSIPTAYRPLARMRRGTPLGPHGMDVFAPGGKVGAKYAHANVPIPPPRSPRAGLGARASATVRSTGDGGTNA
ncbi:hypothetical protein [Streptomyces sp. NPDC101455]|uniref:hypothetical protein n=1 Tax=Streptomyces sp. NPDC101455 TaxID=3366142 RepID=UPI0037F1E8AC